MMIDTDSEDELPSRWEERVMTDGRVYYAKLVILKLNADSDITDICEYLLPS